jgi:hypothetical protein
MPENPLVLPEKYQVPFDGRKTLKHPNRITLDHHLAESDFVFQTDIVENGFDLRFELGK